MKLKYVLKALQNSSKTPLKLCSFSTAPEIEIPKRIHRNSTDILKAIASTYQRDPTAAHYKYHDDPFLIPYSNQMKRSYALSQESGRKAAQWVRKEHADLFQHKVADPMIEAFAPKPVYTEDSEVSEEILLKLIHTAFVSDAISVYDLLKKKGVDVSLSTKESLLECLCYFNSEEPISEDWIEERWFRHQKRNNTNLWRPHGLIDELFNELKETVPTSYSALIAGMCMHGEVSQAIQVYEESRRKVIPLNVEVYNALLSKAYLMRESHDKIWNLTKDILDEMNHMKVQPNVRTLNGVLETLSYMSTYNFAKKLASQTLAEFKKLGVEPSLASFLHLLELYYRDKPALMGLMSKVLNTIEMNTYSIQDPKDIKFFVRAMEICCQLKNLDFGYRLHNLALKDDNYNFIGDSFKESVYYRNFFFLLVNAESLEKFMELYDKLVPGIYVPEPAVINAILKAIMNNLAWSLVPRMWTDIVLFRLYEVSGVLENILICTASSTDPSLNEQMCKIAWDVWERIENQKRERNPVQWTGSILGNIVLTLLNGGEKPKAHLAMDKLVRLGSTLSNEPPVESVKAYVQCCIQERLPGMAIKTIQFCDDMGFVETSQLAQDLNSSLELSDRQRELLASIVGSDCLKPQAPPQEKSK